MKLVKKIITYIRQSKFQEVILGMTTNAVLLDKHMDYLAENKFQLVISLDGNHNNHSYRVDHSNRNSFPRVFKNIKLLQEKHPKYFQDYVQFNSVLHNRNSVEEIYDFINHNFGKLPLISALNTVGIRKEKTEEFRKMYQNVNESILNSSNCNSIEADMFINTPRVLNLTKYIFIHSGNVFNDFNDLIFDISGRYPKQTGTCSPFAKKMFVTVSGKILQCERIPHYFSIGKVLKDRVELNAKDIANKQNQYSSKIISQCDRCYLNKECPQCIYNIEDICNENPECSCFCDEKKSKKNREMTIMYLREHPEYYEKIMNDVIIK